MQPHKNCGFINFRSPLDAAKAKVALNGLYLKGTVLKVGYAKAPVEQSHSPFLADLLSERSNSISSTGSQFLPLGPYQVPFSASSSMTHVNLPSQKSFTQKAANAFQFSNPTDLFPLSHETSFLESETSPTMNRYQQFDFSTSTLSLDSKYATVIPPLPQSSNRRVTQNRLKELRWKLEGSCSQRELEKIYDECFEDSVELATGMWPHLLVFSCSYTL